MNPPMVNGVTPAPAIGFVCIAGGLPPVYGGMAREATDPPLTPMSPDMVTNIASVSKTITAIAILQLLVTDGLTINNNISPYIYPDWQQGQNVSQLTFGELLTHTSGFGQSPNCGNGDAYSDVEALVAGGVILTNIGQVSYGNCNFALLRELMPALLGQSPTCFSFFGPPQCFPYAAQRAEMSSTLYINYVNANVFQPVGVPASTCAPPAGSSGMLSYPSPTNGTPGNNWGDWSLTCGGGGWNLSANQIFSVINGLANGNALLTNSEKTAPTTGMFPNCLGWDCVTGLRGDCPSPNVCKNGYLGANCDSVAVWTYAGIFTTVTPVIPVVVVVNSPTPPPFAGYHVASNTPEAPDIIDLIANAYCQAAVSGTPQGCP
jgi:CubicO group peptidase (beta-lactamase class C family)